MVSLLEKATNMLSYLKKIKAWSIQTTCITLINLHLLHHEESTLLIRNISQCSSALFIGSTIACIGRAGQATHVNALAAPSLSSRRWIICSPEVCRSATPRAGTLMSHDHFAGQRADADKRTCTSDHKTTIAIKYVDHYYHSRVYIYIYEYDVL